MWLFFELLLNLGGVGVGRDLVRSSGPTTLLKCGHLELVVQHRVQKLLSLCGQSVPVFCHSGSRRVFSGVQIDPPMFHFVPVASGPVSGHHREGSDFVLVVWTSPLSSFAQLCPSALCFLYKGAQHWIQYLGVTSSRLSRALVNYRPNAAL